MAGVVFAVLTVAQVRVLPPRAVQEQERGVLGSWWVVVTNRRSSFRSDHRVHDA